MEEHGLPTGQLGQQPQYRARGRPSGRLELDCDQVCLRGGGERVDVDAERHDSVLAFEPLARGLRGRRRGRKECVDACTQAVPS